MSSPAVIIPSKTVSNLAPCVKAVLLREPRLDTEDIIVVDDGIEWDDDAREICRGCTVLPGEKPFNFARNCNIGIKHTLPLIDVTTFEDKARGQKKFIHGRPQRDVALLNDDALLESDEGFTLLSEEAAEHVDYGIIGATTNLTGQPLQNRQNVGLRQVPHIAFVCVLIPARTLRLIGFLDERYVLDYGCEDSDYCEAVTRAGLKVGVHDGCYVDHGSLRSSFRGDPKQPKTFSQNMGLLLQKWGKRLSA